MKYHIQKIRYENVDLRLTRTLTRILKKFGLAGGELEDMLIKDDISWKFKGVCIFYVGTSDLPQQTQALKDMTTRLEPKK